MTNAATPTTTARPQTAKDFESVLDFDSPPESVLAALRDAEAIAGWWGVTNGSPTDGAAFSVGFGGNRQIDMVVGAAGPQRVEWQVEAAPFTPEWDGTTIVFEVERAGEGTTVRFRHLGLTPQLDCFDMCHAGWTHYLASLVGYVDRGEGQPYAGD